MSAEPSPAPAQEVPDLFRRDSNVLRNQAEDAVNEAADQLDGLDLNFIAEASGIYDAAFVDHPVSVGKAISKKEREETNQNASTLVYGEINFEAFATALEKIRHKYGRPNEYNTGPEGIMQRPGGVFYDLGSGTGKPVVAAAIVHAFERCTGIEFLEGLHVTALEVLQRWEAEVQFQLERGADERTAIEFVHGDCCDPAVKDWSDADVIFANSTCFDNELMDRIAARAASCQRGTIMVTLTRRLPSDHFVVLEHELHQMSWGSATVYIQQKTTEAVSS